MALKLRICVRFASTFNVERVAVLTYDLVICKDSNDCLSVHNLFNPNQHGFRHGCSCLSALLDVYDNMMRSLSNNPKSSVDMIYLDYAKAFDKVDHGVLLNKLKTFGICGKLGEWLHSFLTNRRHRVRITGGVSKSDNVLSGVPQGTVLGPVLFLVLISDIWNNVDSNITSFADDTKVFATINNPSDCDTSNLILITFIRGHLTTT